MLGQEKVLFEALDVATQASEALYVVLEVKAEGGNEEKLGLVLLDSDIVIISDATDVLSATSRREVASDGEFVVDFLIPLLECLNVGSFPCLVVISAVVPWVPLVCRLDVVNCSDDSTPGITI